jgi:hypothetical protein
MNLSYTAGRNVNKYKPLWKTVWRLLKKLKIELPYDPAILLLAQRNLSEVTRKAPEHQCLLQHYSKQLSYGNSHDAPLLMNGLRKCGIYKPWNFIQSKKQNEILSFSGKWMEMNIILSEVSHVQKTKNPVFSHICNIDLIHIQAIL